MSLNDAPQPASYTFAGRASSALAVLALGAGLITGFMGAAICSHFRLGEFASARQATGAALGILAWAGLSLRMPEWRSLLPLRRGRD